jgi:hypothetical protein
VSAAPEGTGEVEYYMDKRFGDTDRTHLAPGTIAPEDTKNIGYPYDKNIGYPYEQKAVFDQPQPLMASITRVVVTDAAGYQWEMRRAKPGLPGVSSGGGAGGGNATAVYRIRLHRGA